MQFIIIQVFIYFLTLHSFLHHSGPAQLYSNHMTALHKNKNKDRNLEKRFETLPFSGWRGREQEGDVKEPVLVIVGKRSHASCEAAAA